MNLSDISLDFTSVRRAYASGELNPVELIDEIYRRVALDDDPYIWLHIVPKEAALEQADRIRKARERGEELPLYGLPYGVKDNIDVAGVPTTAGSSAFSYVPLQSAAVVARLNAAGAILIGKQNMDQFATGLVGTRSLNGHCRNAFNRAYIPGGSSSGSAVAVAKGHVAFSIGSDTGGSGRVPAACNNIVGLKPTPGLISTSGFVYCNRTFDVAPVFALTVDDAYDVFDILIGADARDPFSVSVNLSDESISTSEPFTFGVILDAQLDFFGDEQARRQYERAIEQLVELGGESVPIDFSPFLAAGDLVFNSGFLAERAIAYGETVNRHPDSIHPAVLSALRSAQSYSAADVFDALYRLRGYRARVATVFETLRMIALPTCGTLPTCEAIEMDPIAGNARMGRYTYFANPLGLPVVNVPAGLREDGLPFGLSLVGASFADRQLKDIARALQASTSDRLGATSHALPGSDLRHGHPADVL